MHGELLKKQLKDNITIANLKSELEKSKSLVDKLIQASIAAENALLQTEQAKIQNLTKQLKSAEKSNNYLATENKTLKIA